MILRDRVTITETIDTGEYDSHGEQIFEEREFGEVPAHVVGRHTVVDCLSHECECFPPVRNDAHSSSLASSAPSSGGRCAMA